MIISEEKKVKCEKGIFAMCSHVGEHLESVS